MTCCKVALLIVVGVYAVSAYPSTSAAAAIRIPSAILEQQHAATDDVAGLSDQLDDHNSLSKNNSEKWIASEGNDLTETRAFLRPIYVAGNRPLAAASNAGKRKEENAANRRCRGPVRRPGCRRRQGQGSRLGNKRRRQQQQKRKTRKTTTKLPSSAN